LRAISGKRTFARVYVYVRRGSVPHPRLKWHRLVAMWLPIC
jgi:hypothetical protein